MIPAQRYAALAAHLTWRCPLRCATCPNPVRYRGRGRELPTDAWLRVIDEAADLGIRRLELTGGEPLLRGDLERLVARARERALDAWLVTSGLGLTAPRVRALADAGLERVRIAIPAVDGRVARRICGDDPRDRQREAARRVVEAGLELTVQAVLHRENAAEVPAMLALAEQVGARRIALSFVRDEGWARVNRAALRPAPAQVERAREEARAARALYRGAMEVVVEEGPDRTLGITPDGSVLPREVWEATEVVGWRLRRPPVVEP